MSEREYHWPEHLPASTLYNLPIFGPEGRIGYVCDLAVDERNWRVRHVLVDTGLWRLGRRVLLDPSLLCPVANGKSLRVALTRREARRLPHHTDDPTVSTEAYSHMVPMPPRPAGLIDSWIILPIEIRSRLRSLRTLCRYALMRAGRKDPLGRMRDARIRLADWRVIAFDWDDRRRQRRRLAPDRIDEIIFDREILYVAPAALE